MHFPVQAWVCQVTFFLGLSDENYLLRRSTSIKCYKEITIGEIETLFY
jgi:hypothetical protein